VARFSKKAIRPGNRIRVLIVDDSVVIRRLVSLALEEESAIEVVGAAANGAIALAKIPQVNPDAVTLDIEMPEMDGLEALRRVRKQYPDLRVIMFSTLTERGASATFEALALGADDYVTKAANVGSLGSSLISLREELIPKIKQFFQLPGDLAPPPEAVTAVAPVPAPRPRTFPFPVRPRVLVIGVSTGGPTALGAIVGEFPVEFPLPILMVQHMPPVFTRLLAERLQDKCALRVEEAANGSVVEKGKILIAPGGYHMLVGNSGGQMHVTLDQTPPENSCRPAVDVMFRSVEEAYGGAVISVILTGMGYDGLRGVRALKASGAYVIAQDEASSVVWGMPGAVVEAGLADAVVPLDGVVAEILKYTGGRG
jgi:two-component system chemotaxis response regulator CheB